MGENVLKDKSYVFALRIVKLYDYSEYRGAVETTDFKYKNSKTT